MTTPTEVSARMAQRYDTAAQWTNENPILLAGEIGIESDTGYIKVGNGSTQWTGLAYVSGLGAEIPVSRLADGDARQLLQTDAAGTGVEWTSDVDVPGTLDVTGAATFDTNVTIEGDLTVNGTTTTIDTETLLVKDKNIEMAVVTTPTDVTADGGGITLRGATDKTINWINATDAWTSSERFDFPAGTEAAPSIILNGDVNSGIYQPAADQVAISTNGTGRLFVDADGRVGINSNAASNTLTPLILKAASGTPLHFYADSAYWGLFDGGGTTGGYAPNNGYAGHNGSNYLNLFTAGNERLRITSTGEFEFTGAGTAGTTQAVYFSGSAPVNSLVIDSTGNVGLGTASPNTRLHVVSGSGSGSVQIGNSADSQYHYINFGGSTNSHNAWQMGRSPSGGIGPANGFYIYDLKNSATRLAIDSSGRVGIGTSNPSSKLEVVETTAAEALRIDGAAGGYALVVNGGSARSTAIKQAVIGNSYIGTTPPTDGLIVQGSVGIGTTSPGSALNIVNTAADNTSGIRLKGHASGNIGCIFTDLNNLNLAVAGAHTFTNFDGTVERARIDSSGRLGLGTTNPVNKLQVTESAVTSVPSAGSSGHMAVVGSSGFGIAAAALNNGNGYLQVTRWDGTATNYNLLLQPNGGNVGIGTTSPGHQLTLKQSIAATSDAAPTQIKLENGSDGGAAIEFSNAVSGAAKIALGVEGTGGSTDDTFIGFSTSLNTTLSERARIDSSGRLLVGTNSYTGNATILAQGHSGDVNGPAHVLLKTGTTSPSDGSDFGYLFFSDANTSGGFGAWIVGQRDGGTWTSGSSMPGRLVFSTTLDGASSPTERMRITAAGAILMATVSTSVNDVGYIFDPSGQSFVSVNASTSATNTLHVYSTNASAYRFYVGMDGTVNATNTTISAISDQRLKENVRDLDTGLNEIMALQPRRFDWKTGKGKNIQNDQGFIAQEFEQVFPEMISEWIDPAPEGEEPYKAVRADLIPVLVKAIQEQQTIINSLEARLAALEAQ